MSAYGLDFFKAAWPSNLPPRNYRFHVMACNNSGVWNEAGTFLNFSVAPAYYQTWWFRSLCVAAFLGLLAAAYQLRLQQVARQFNMRMEERVNERTRIARAGSFKIKCRYNASMITVAAYHRHGCSQSGSRLIV